MMKERLGKMMILGLFLLAGSTLSAQEDPEKAVRAAKKYMQQAEEALADNDLATAEAMYRQAIAKDPANAEARYNLGNLYYNNEITGEAVQRHTQSAKVTEEKPLRHDSYHNQGNAYMKQKKYKEAVEAYKNSLRNNPNDEETRYNLALAKKLLEEEKKGGGDENKDDQKKDQQDQKKDQQQDNKKDQEGDEGEKEKNEEGKPEDKDKGGEKDNKDKKEGEDKKEDEGKPQNQDKQQDQGEKSEEEQPRQPQPRPGQLSPQQVKNLLEAMGNEEKKVQDKINAKKMKGAQKKTEKDW